METISLKEFREAGGGSLHCSHCTRKCKMLQTLTKASEMISGISDTSMGLVGVGHVPFWSSRQAGHPRLSPVVPGTASKPDTLGFFCSWWRGSQRRLWHFIPSYWRWLQLFKGLHNELHSLGDPG